MRGEGGLFLAILGRPKGPGRQWMEPEAPKRRPAGAGSLPLGVGEWNPASGRSSGLLWKCWGGRGETSPLMLGAMCMLFMQVRQFPFPTSPSLTAPRKAPGSPHRRKTKHHQAGAWLFLRAGLGGGGLGEGAWGGGGHHLCGELPVLGLRLGPGGEAS